MKRLIIISLLVSLTLVLTAQAQTTSSATSVEDLQKQIQLLLSQLGSLQKEITAIKSATPAPTTSATVPATSATTPPTSILPPSILPVYSPLLEIDESEVGETETTYVPPPTLTRSLFRGSRGEDVRQLQEFLAQDPTIYPDAIATGYYGIGTEAAVRRWQAKNGVPAVGIVGRQTIAKFKELYQGITPTKPPVIYPTKPVLCPAVYSPETCPAGEERYVFSRSEQCGAIYACRPSTNVKKEICPALPTVDACPAGEERIVTYKSEQCGVYYACKPRTQTRVENTIVVLKKISSIQTDNRYNLIISDPDGVQKYSVYSSKDRQVYLGYPACRTNETTPVINAESSDFPLKLSLSDCGNPSSYFSTNLSTPVVVKPIEEGLTFPYKFSSGKIVYSSEEARSYCYANGPSSGQGIAGECETKFGVVYTTHTTTTASRAIYSADSFATCMARYGFAAEAKQIKTWAQSPDAIPWSALTSSAQNSVTACEREYYGQQTVEVGSVLCSDGKDNDGDGFVDAADPSCSVTTTTTPAGQKEQVWNSLGLKSWIRSDADSARIDQLKSACASVPSGSNIWTPNAGLPSSADFGMPDTSKCQRASSCTASQRFDGSACVANTTTTTTTTTTAQCSDGRDNDGDGLIDYPSDTGCYSKDDHDETPGTSTTADCSKYGSGWHMMTEPGICFDTDMKNYRTVNGTLYSCSTTPTTGCSGTTSTTTTAQCSDGRDNDSDGLIDYPSDTGCYGPADTDEAYGGTTTTTTSSCPNSQLTTLLGSGCHFMYSTPTGNIYCDGPMTKSAREGDTVAATGCTSPSTTGGGSTYAGDANSCPGFAYSRWDQQNRRYCQLNTETRCDYNYPSYLTNGANYTAANCPTYVSGPALGVCSSLGSDWTVYGNYCLNNSRTQYAPTGSSLSSVQSCTGTDTPVASCTPPGGSTTTTTTSSCPNSQLTTLLGSGCHFMYSTPTGNIYCDGPMTKSAREGDTTATSGCQAPTTTTTTSSTTSCAGTPASCTNETQCATASYYWYDGSCHSSPRSQPTTTTTTTCPSGQYWSGTACVSSTTTTTTTTTASCPSGYHSMGSYCMSDSNSTQCQPTSGGAVYTCSSTPTASVYDVTSHTVAQIKTVLSSLQNSLQGLRR